MHRPNIQLGIIIIIEILIAGIELIAQDNSKLSANTIQLNMVVKTETARQYKINFSADIQLAEDGTPVVITHGCLMKISDWMVLSPQSVFIDRFASTALGIYFVIVQDQLGLVFEKKFAPITKLPNRGMSVIAHEMGETLYVYGEVSDGTSAIYQISLKSDKDMSNPKSAMQNLGKPKFREYIHIKEKIGAVCILAENDILFAAGNSVYRSRISSDTNNLQVLILATIPSAKNIFSLDIDHSNNVLYVSSDSGIFRCHNSQVLPILPMIGKTIVARTLLYILETQKEQVLAAKLPYFEKKEGK